MTRGRSYLTEEERKQADRDRKRKAREEMRARGLRPYEVWVTAGEWARVKRYIERLAQRRPTARHE